MSNNQNRNILISNSLSMITKRSCGYTLGNWVNGHRYCTFFYFRREIAMQFALLVPYMESNLQCILLLCEYLSATACNNIWSVLTKILENKQKAVILWTLDPAERDAKLAREALRKKGLKHHSVIIEIACTSSPHHLIAVRQAYCLLYNCSLEEDIALQVAQPLRKVNKPIWHL